MQKEKVKYYRCLIKLIFLTGLFASPFIFWPWSEIPFEIPKVKFVILWIEIIGILGLISSFFVLKKRKIDNWIILFALLFLLQAIISSIFGVNLTKSYFGNYYRQDGIFTLIHLIILFIFVSLFFQKNWLTKTYLTLGLSAIFLSLITVISRLTDTFFGIFLFEPWENNSQGITFGNPNFLSGYLLVTLPFTYNLLIKQNRYSGKILSTSAIIIQIVAIILTKSTFGLIGIALFFLLITFSTKNRRLTRFSILAFAIILTTTAFFFFRSFSTSATLVAEGRTRIFTKAFLAFQHKPVLGWGWANFDHAFEAVEWPIRLNDDVYVDKAHSHLLEIILTTGILGFFIYMGLLVKITINLFNQKDSLFPVFAAFILFFIHSQTNVISISEEIIFWLSAGIATKNFTTNL